MKRSLTIKSARGLGRLEISAQESDKATRWDYLDVTLTLEALHARARVYNHYYAQTAGGLNIFFADLAANWRGWEGEKHWASIEGDFKLSCSMDSLGHVEFLIVLRLNASDPEWELQGRLWVEAGQLDSIAKETSKFFAYE